jgi:hypothetical protein
MPRPPRPALTTSQAPHCPNGIDHPVRALATLARLLARQAARAHFQHSVIEGEGHEEVDDDVRAAADGG